MFEKFRKKMKKFKKESFKRKALKKLKKESSKGKFKKKVQERGKLWLKTECGEKLCWLETCFFWML